MYGRNNFVRPDPTADKPLRPPRLLLGVAADDVDQAGQVVNWLVSKHGFLAAKSLADLDAVRHEIELGRHLVVRHVDIDEQAWALRRRGGCVLHVPGLVRPVRVIAGDFVLSVPPEDSGFAINMQMVLQALLDDLKQQSAA